MRKPGPGAVRKPGAAHTPVLGAAHRPAVAGRKPELEAARKLEVAGRTPGAEAGRMLRKGATIGEKWKNVDTIYTSAVLTMYLALEAGHKQVALTRRVKYKAKKEREHKMV